MNPSRTPVVVFAYRRPRHLEKVLKALVGQPEAGETQLILFLDGPRGSSDRSDVAAVKEVAEEAKGFLDVRICTAEKNKGLARSITEGVGTVCREYGKAIVLEDDIVPLPGFLSFMNEALGKYRDNRNVMQISGYAYPIPNEALSHLFLPLTSCWGWATWQRAWTAYVWDREEAKKDLQNPDFVSKFDLEGAYPYSKLLQDVVNGKSDSWAVVWYWNIFRSGGLSLFPSTSMVENIGWDGSGAHEEGQEDSFDECRHSISYDKFLWPSKININPKSFEDVRKCIIQRELKRMAYKQKNRWPIKAWEKFINCMSKIHNENTN